MKQPDETTSRRRPARFIRLAVQCLGDRELDDFAPLSPRLPSSGDVHTERALDQSGANLPAHTRTTDGKRRLQTPVSAMKERGGKR